MVNENQKSEKYGCVGGCCSGEPAKKVLVEYLYLDLNTCDRCIGTDKVLDEVMIVLTTALELAGFKVEYNKIEMKTVDVAKQYRGILRICSDNN